MSDLRLLCSRTLLCLAVIAAGLALRRFGLGAGLPPSVVKYGGSLLWGAMVYFIAAILACARPRLLIAMIAASIALAVELSRLYHSPELDAFRVTSAGALLLGRVFSLWNLAAYSVGVTLGLTLDAAHARSTPQTPAQKSCPHA